MRVLLLKEPALKTLVLKKNFRNSNNNTLQMYCLAVTGIFNILNLYWDVIPAHVIAIQCRNLYTNLAFDACISVRLAVFQVSFQLSPVVFSS